ncbi:MAG: diphthine--ammonia ligase [Thermoflexibacteraceae bacterium]
MSNAIPTLFNWSGGKDSALALYHLLQQKNKYDIKSLLTSVNQHYRRVSMHGVRITLLEQQAAQIGIPLHKIELPETLSMDEYSQLMQQTLEQFQAANIHHAAFGDIFLEDLRTYREQQLAKVGMQAVFPLWGKPTKEVLLEFIEKGFQAVIVCVNAKYLDPSFLGRLLDKSFLEDLPPNVDICGENGEYHSFVFDAPIFNQPIPFTKGEIVEKKFADNAGVFDTQFYYLDLY